MSFVSVSSAIEKGLSHIRKLLVYKVDGFRGIDSKTKTNILFRHLATTLQEIDLVTRNSVISALGNSDAYEIGVELSPAEEFTIYIRPNVKKAQT